MVTGSLDQLFSTLDISDNQWEGIADRHLHVESINKAFESESLLPYLVFPIDR